MLQFDFVQPQELPQVTAFLRRIFEVPAEHRTLQPEVLHWKYFAPHPLWEGSRSCVFRKDGELVAHGCVPPFRWLTSQGRIQASCVIDWAADRSVPGIGLALFRKIAERFDGLAGIGGSEDARAVLPHAGFCVLQDFAVLRRVIRPAAHHLAGARSADWKTPARLARDVVRLTRAAARAPAGWSATRVPSFDAWIESALPTPGRPSPSVAERSAALLNYALDCPAAAMEAYRIEGPGQIRGYILLSKIQGECRVCDLGVSDATPEAWRAAAALAIASAQADQDITAIRVGTTAQVVRNAFETAGFQAEPMQPVFYWDRANKGIQPGEFSLTDLDNDFYYL